MPKHKFKSPHGVPKRQKCAIDCSFNPSLVDGSEKYKGVFKSGSVMSDGCVNLKSQPFPTCQLLDLVDPRFLGELKEELNSLELMEKDNDLYRFLQSEELNNLLHLPYLQQFRTSLVTNLKPVISNMTGIELDDRLALFHARYSRGDYLLCHDDELEGRCIAFILYLVPENWGPQDGGGLQLFSTGKDGSPGDVVETLVPKNNTLIYFEVSPISFHQVAEVLTDKTRLSLGGWFHGKTLPRPEKPLLCHESGQSYIDVSEEIFMGLVNPVYLNVNTQAEIQERFEETSEISLPGFFVEAKFQEICDKLREVDNWKQDGPSNRRNTQSRNEFSASDGCLSEMFDLMRSDAMFLLLSNLTGLRLHQLAPVDSDDESSEDPDKPIDPKWKGKMRKWGQGNYTLVCDDDLGQAEFALDARICFNVNNWSEEMGGQSVYIARNEDDVLIKCDPENNSLNLVYRDKESLRFVKYVNNLISANGGPFYDIDFTYYE